MFDTTSIRTLLGAAVAATLPLLASCGGAGAGAGGSAGLLTTQPTNSGVNKVQVVRMGTGNEITKVDDTKNAVPYTAAVGDADGNPVAGVQVSASLRSLRYRKGTFIWNGDFWQQVVTAECSNEDLNGNLVLDPGEDTNGDTYLTPANAAVATPSSAVSAATGFVDMKVTYPRDHSLWLEARLTVEASIGAGTESTASRDFWLPGVANDYTKQDQGPPGFVSPYGMSANCADPF
jgi:hypothetical protein